MKKIFWIIIGIVFLLTACMGLGIRPTDKQINSADYGPFPKNWKQIVSDTLAGEMVMPETLYIRKIEPPIKAWVITPGGEFICGWGVCGMVVMGVSSLEPFFILIHYDKPIYAALGFEIAKRIPGQTWLRRGITGDIYNCCSNLYKY